MTRTIEKYQQSDVNFWGFLAIGCVGVAFGMANVSAMMPSSWLAGMHATRSGGGSFAELQNQVTALRMETARLRSDSGRLNTMLTLGDFNAQDVTKRVGALESTIPVLLEQIPLGPNIDSASLTASVNSPPQDVIAAEGGSVAVSMQPLVPAIIDQAVPSELPEMPQQASVDSNTPAAEAPMWPTDAGLTSVVSEKFGLAMGKSVNLAEAYIYWTDIHSEVGALLMDMEPILSPASDGTYHLVAGPLNAVADAEGLCAHILRAGLQCLPVPYSGYKLPK